MENVDEKSSRPKPKPLHINDPGEDHERDDRLERQMSSRRTRPNEDIEAGRDTSDFLRTPRDTYSLSPFFSTSMQDLSQAAITPATVHLTVINTVQSPAQNQSLGRNNSWARGLGSLGRKDSPNNGSLDRKVVPDFQLSEPNQVRAFGRRALSFQRRQWFDNICCITLCPFLMVFFSFVLKTAISGLSDGGKANYEVLYCSNYTSTNQQNWPIYNLTGFGIHHLNQSQVPGAAGPVYAVNYLSRLSLVDLTGRDPVAQLLAASVAGSIPCVQWFGEEYPVEDSSVYESLYNPLHPYSNKDSVYSSEIDSGWLDVLAPTQGGTQLTDPYARQAISLLRTFVAYQSRPWSIVASDPSVSDALIGSAPKEDVLTNPSAIPGTGTLYYKNAQIANGILDTIEPRYYVLATALPPSLSGFQKVPFFDKNYTSEDSLSESLYERLTDAVKLLNAVPPIDQNLNKISPDIATAETVFNLQRAVFDVPFTGLYFKKIDHVNKTYSYTMQVGTNPVISNVMGFPTAGFRATLQQSQLSNGILRFSNASLGTTVITQGTRAFPYLEKAQIGIPFGSIIGRILYPLGISFLLPIFTLILVKDKETKILVMLRMNGLGDVTGYYVSTYILFYINYCLSAIIFLVTGYAVSLELFVKTSAGILIILLLLWGHIQITLAFIFSALFRSSSVATVGVFILTVCGVVTSFILDQVFESTTSFPIPLYIWPPFLFYRILDMLNRHATSTLLGPYTFKMLVPGDIVFNGIFIMAAEVVILMAAAIYLSQVMPTEFGTQRSWHYPLTDSYLWKGKEGSVIEITEKKASIAPEDSEKEDDDVRRERTRIITGDYPSDAPLVMQGMRKEYSTGKVKNHIAVKDVAFAVENNVVFGLLGPNGAGKTTLISILTGVYPSTAGLAHLAGYNIDTHPELALRSIGVCPQFDILWPELTVEDHLYFYARLKGVGVAFEDDAVFAALDLVQMTDLRARVVKGLSGGERRRVSIAIALVSNPKVEPTTGLDPEVRRTVWDTIARARGNRAILMTTHSMEEAEVCCQTIGIMAKGRMRCLGSPTRLKYLYGCGYKLSITSDDMDRSEELISSILPSGWRVLHSFSTSRRYGFIPDAVQLGEVFDILVKRSTDFGIKTWGISQTTLDEIFTTIVSAEDANSS